MNQPKKKSAKKTSASRRPSKRPGAGSTKKYAANFELANVWHQDGKLQVRIRDKRTGEYTCLKELHRHLSETPA